MVSNGKLHRTDGPARDWPKEQFKSGILKDRRLNRCFTNVKREDGTKRYYNEKGELHRTYGPAVECANGIKSGT
jgi:hypothetical protein